MDVHSVVFAFSQIGRHNRTMTRLIFISMPIKLQYAVVAWLSPNQLDGHPEPRSAHRSARGARHRIHGQLPFIVLYSSQTTYFFLFSFAVVSHVRKKQLLIM